MKNMILIFLICLWLFLGMVGNGLIAAYFDGRYPNYPRSPREFRVKQVFDTLLGPLSLLGHVLFLLVSTEEGFEYGIKFHPTKPKVDSDLW